MTRAAPDSAAGSGPAAAVVDGIDVDAVAEAVRACAAVDDLYSSPAASVASYLPGRQVAGVRVGSDTVTVQVRSRWGIPIDVVAGQIRGAVTALVNARAVDVVIADIADPPEAAPLQLPAAGPVSPADVLQTEPIEFEPTDSDGDIIVWTSSSDAPGGGSSSGAITPTGVEKPPSS